MGGVLVCQVPGTQTSDCGRRYGKDLSPPGRVLFCPSAPNTSRVASVGPLSLSRLTRKHSANCSHAPAGRLAFALSVGGLPRRSTPCEAWKLGSTRWKAGAWTPLANPTLLLALEHGSVHPAPGRACLKPRSRKGETRIPKIAPLGASVSSDCSRPHSLFQYFTGFFTPKQHN